MFMCWKTNPCSKLLRKEVHSPLTIHTGRSNACCAQHCFGKAHIQLFIYQSVWRLSQEKLNLSLDVQMYTQFWPCPGVSSDGATVSPDPSCLSLQYLCCSSLCVGGLVSVCYIWSTSPVHSVSCVNLSVRSLILSFFLSLGGPEP